MSGRDPYLCLVADLEEGRISETVFGEMLGKLRGDRARRRAFHVLAGGELGIDSAALVLAQERAGRKPRRL